jgi:hypothetical protein
MVTELNRRVFSAVGLGSIIKFVLERKRAAPSNLLHYTSVNIADNTTSKAVRTTIPSPPEFETHPIIIAFGIKIAMQSMMCNKGTRS